MTIANRAATTAYLCALNDMPDTDQGDLAALADRMAGAAFSQGRPYKVKPMSQDAMMGIETAIFTALCDANGIDWRRVRS